MSRRKVKKEQSFEDFVEEKWDKKKILVGLFTLIALVGGAYYIITQTNLVSNSPFVLGVTQTGSEDAKSRQEVLSTSKDDVNKIVERINNDIKKLTEENIKPSSEQIQKIMKDLQGLQNKEKQPQDVICEFVCKGK